jgi:hypothetical protein
VPAAGVVTAPVAPVGEVDGSCCCCWHAASAIINARLIPRTLILM